MTNSNKYPYKYPYKYPLCRYLPKDIIDTMGNLTKKTHVANREYGFLLCTGAKRPSDITDKNTIAKEICEGGMCAIEVTGDCPENMKTKGWFHTHPSGVTLPTLDDIEYSKHQNYKFLCIGGDEEIRCMSSKIPLDIIPVSEIEIDKLEEYKRKLKDCTINLVD